MLPEQLLAMRYGEVPLTHVGDLKIVGTDVAPKEMAFYAARIKCKNLVPHNLLIIALPLRFDSQTVRTPTISTLSTLEWTTVYLRSYFDLKNLQATIGLDWSKIADTEEYSPSSTELPGGVWIKEVREKTGRGQRNKYYTLEEESLAGNYVISVESRNRDVTHGTGLKSEFELDLLLNFDSYNLAIEKLSS
jgi:hypothetical protein